MRFSLALTMLLLAGTAQGACRQALALGLDISGSVDAQEYRLQTEGLANAVQADAVSDAFLAQTGWPVALMVYEWSGPTLQRVILPWTDVDSTATLKRIAETIAGAQRATGDPSTAIGNAMRFGLDALDQRSDCLMRTLDISGDGQRNTGVPTEALRARAQDSRTTINGLIIASDNRDGGDHRQQEVGALWAHFSTQVIAGPDAFVETALGFADFESAMTRKLLRELASPVFSALPRTGSVDKADLVGPEPLQPSQSGVHILQ